MVGISNREAAILGLLCEGPHHGYELEKVITERGMRTWTEIGFSSIYYVLNRLERARLIRSTREEVEGKPSRRVYTVTERGLEAMKEKVRTLLSESKKAVTPFDLGVAYHHLLEPEDVRACLLLYLQSLEEREAFLQRSVGEQTNYRVRALFSRPLVCVRAEKAWVEQFITEVGGDHDG